MQTESVLQTKNRSEPAKNLFSVALPETFRYNFFQNICNNTEMNSNFHFSHYKSMET